MNIATQATCADLDFLSLAEVADMLRLSRVSVYRLAAKGLLPVYRLCRKMQFKRQDVLDFVERSRDAATSPYGPED